MTGGVLALDLGTACSAFAFADGAERPVWGKTSFSQFADCPNADGAIVEALADWIGVLIARYQPSHMAAEEPWIPQPRAPKISAAGQFVIRAPAVPVNAQTVRRLSAMFGRAAGIAYRYKITWRSVDSWTVEKHFLGKSGHKSAEKKRLTKQMCEIQGWRPVGLDEADSLALLSWGLASLLPPHAQRAGPLFSQPSARRSAGY